MNRSSAALRGCGSSALVTLVGLALLSCAARAHDIPNEIVMSGFVRPAGDRLHVLVRIPLIMLANLNLPKRGPGYLALDRLEEALPRAVAATAREMEVYEGETRLTHSRARSRISQPAEQAFQSYDEALAHIEGPKLPANTNVFWNQGYFDLHLRYPIRSDRSRFSLNFKVAPGLSGRLKLVVRFRPPEGPTLAYVVHGGFGRLELNPSWYYAGSLFVNLGFEHILEGIDHLLFLLCLVIPFRLRDFWRLVAVVTAFTVAHSITLIASALDAIPGGEWFPPLVETLIAVSILYMALENVVAALHERATVNMLRWRWIITAVFGLVHGFGFSFALQEDLQLAGPHLLVSLLAFNVRVEIGQILVLLVVLPITALLFRRSAVRRLGLVIVSIVVAHVAWHWMTERAESLQYVDWPTLEPGALWTIAVGALLLGCLGGIAWLMARQAERRRHNARRDSL